MVSTSCFFGTSFDNVVYRLDLVTTVARQFVQLLIKHPLLTENVLIIPSYRVTEVSDLSSRKSGAKVPAILEAAEEVGRPAFVIFDADKLEGSLTALQNAMKSTQKSTKQFVVEFLQQNALI